MLYVVGRVLGALCVVVLRVAVCGLCCVTRGVCLVVCNVRFMPCLLWFVVLYCVLCVV